MNERTTTHTRRMQVPEQLREQIIELHHLSYGTRRIARRVGLSRKLVRRILNQTGLCQSRPQGQPNPGVSKLEPFVPLIEEKVKKGLTTTRILREIRAAGFAGGRTIVADRVRQMRASFGSPPTRRAKRRFETAAAVEMQIDWSPYRLSVGGRSVVVHALGVLLAFSRKLCVYFFDNERQPTLLEGLAMAFTYFEGAAHRLVLDNMATAVLGRFQPDGTVLWHPRFLDFVRHYGVDPFACRRRDPDRKGKKEKSFRLLWDDFLKGSIFESFADLNARARVWLDHTPEVANQRLHATTRRVPNQLWRDQERALLIALPEERFAVYEPGVRVVDQDATISVRGTRYTVPAPLACCGVALRLYAEHFEVLDGHGRIAFSRRYVAPAEHGRLIIDPSHYASLPRRPQERTERLHEAFTLRFPSLAPLVRGLQVKMKAVAGIHLRALLRLVERYGQEHFLAAAEHAQHYRRYDAGAVERILEQRHGPGTEPPPAPLGRTGPDLVGDVEPGDLGAYANLDAAQNPSQLPDDANNADERRPGQDCASNDSHDQISSTANHDDTNDDHSNDDGHDDEEV